MSTVLDRMAPLLDQDIRRVLLKQRDDLKELNRSLLVTAAKPKAKKEVERMLAAYIREGAAFLSAMKNMTDEQLSRIGAELNK